MEKTTTSIEKIDPRVLVSITDFARMHNVVQNTVYNNIHKGKIIPVKLGPQGQYTFIDISQYGDFKFGRW